MLVMKQEGCRTQWRDRRQGWANRLLEGAGALEPFTRRCSHARCVSSFGGRALEAKELVLAAWPLADSSCRRSARAQGFASIDEAREYYKSDLYRLNQRRKASGRQPLTGATRRRRRRRARPSSPPLLRAALRERRPKHPTAGAPSRVSSACSRGVRETCRGGRGGVLHLRLGGVVVRELVGRRR